MNVLKIVVNLFHFNRTNWKAVALCFIAATVFWVFNALSKTYTTHLRFPLRIEYDETKYAPAGEMPQFVPLNVSGNGWDLFRKSFGVRLPALSLAIENPTEVKKIVASTLPVLLAGQIGDLTINFVVLDTLRLNFDKRISRSFKLVADVSSVSYKQGLGQTGPLTMQPATVELNGPEGILKMMPDSIVLQLPARKLTSNFEDAVEVIIPFQEYIKRNPPVVEISFAVGEMTEITQRIKLVSKNLHWGQVIEKDSIQVTYALPKNNSTVAVNNQLTAVVFLEEQKEEEIRKYQPKVSGLPPYAVLLRTDSVSVKQH